MEKTRLAIFVINNEKVQAKQDLIAQVKMAKDKLSSLEDKLNNGEDVYQYDGLQGIGMDMDICLARYIAYSRAVDIMKNYMDKE